MPLKVRDKKQVATPMPRPDKITRQNVQREIDAEEARKRVKKQYPDAYKSEGGKMKAEPMYAKIGCKVYNNR